jgi:hypothetical protein
LLCPAWGVQQTSALKTLQKVVFFNAGLAIIVDSKKAVIGLGDKKEWLAEKLETRQVPLSNRRLCSTELRLASAIL